MTNSFPVRHLLFLLLVAACLFFLGLGAIPLVEPDEGRNAEVAREMLASGDWITPHFNTLTYLDKPAVFFWMVAGSLRAWGISAWAARFPSALAALAVVLLAWTLARRMFDHSTALRAGIILSTSPLAFGLARFVTFDMTLAFFMTVALAGYWAAEEREHRGAGFQALMFGALGVAAITKGPVGFIIPLLTIVVYQAIRGRLGELRRLRWGLGLAVFLAVALPWFVAVSVRHPDFPRYAFWEESLQRFATGRARRSGSFAYYLPIYLAGFFPWSLFLLFAGWNHLRRWRELRTDRQKPVAFLLAWATVVFLFFSISRSKLPAYFLPAIVPLSILMALAWTDVGAEEARHPPDWLTAGFAALLVLGLIVAFASEFSWLGGIEVRLGKKVSSAVLAAMKPCLLFSGLVLSALAVVGRNVARRSKGGMLSAATFVLIAMISPLLVVRWLPPLRNYAATQSSRDLAAAILASPEKDLPLYGYYYFRTGLPFYLRRPVGLVTAEASELTSNYIFAHLDAHGHAAGRGLPSVTTLSSSADTEETGRNNPNTLLTDEEGLRAFARRGPLLILLRNDRVGALATKFQQIEPLWTGWDYSVWKIPKLETRTSKRETPQ